MNITVTRDDIRYGQRRNPEHCAIARALMRAGLDHFGVMGPSIMVADGSGRLTSLRLPEEVSDWVFNFDAGNPVAPLQFNLALPEPPNASRQNHSTEKAEVPKAFTPLAAPLVLDLELVSLRPLSTKPSKRSTAAPKAPRLRSQRGRNLGLALKRG